MRRWPLLLLLAGALGAAALLLRPSPPPPPRAEPARHVVTLREVAPEVLLAGRLEWGVAAVIHASSDGTLRALHARHLDAVAAGQTLFEIAAPGLEDDLGRARLALLQAQLQLRQHDASAQGPEILQQRAQLAEVDAQIAQARRRADTMRELVAGGIAPRQELVDLTARVEELGTRRFFVQQMLEELERRRSPEARRVMEDQATLAETTLRRLERAAAELEIRSPAAGRLLLSSGAQPGADQPRQVGEAVRRGERLAVIADPARPVVVARADEADAARIRVGAPARAAISIGGQGEIAAVVTEVRRNARPGGMPGAMEEYLATVELARGSDSLLPGAAAVVRIETPRRMAMVVPLRFILIGGARAEVQRLDPATGAASAVLVVTGALLEDGVEVLGGIAPGDTLLELR